MILLRIFLLCTFASAAYGTDDRRVVGGDLLYPGEATAASQEVAVYKATMQAAMRVQLECLVVHRSTVEYETSVERVGNAWTARVVVGLPLDECWAARELPEAERARLAHPVLSPQVAAYEGSLAFKPTAVRAPPVIQPQVVHVHLHPVRVVTGARADCIARGRELVAEARELALTQNRFGIPSGRALDLQERGFVLLTSCEGANR